MTKHVLLVAFIFFSFQAFAQKAQRIGYIDMEYILQNIPEYTEAQNKINAKAITWQNNIDAQQKEIENLKAELNNEKALLTKELIAEKEEDIQFKITELKKLQEMYFGSNGDLFFLRQQLVQPIQDLVYNAVQDIASKRNYDFIFDKSSDLVMLFSNEQYNVSELVLSSINRAEKLNEIKTKREAVTNKQPSNTTVDEATENAISEKEQKRLEQQKKLEEKRAEQLKKREELRKAIEEKRLQRIKEIEEAKQAKEAKKENN